MAYVPVPKDLSKVKTKVAFNLTKRQIVCFAAALLFGLPLFFLLKDSTGTSLASMAMIAVMLPCFLFAMYEKHGQPLEVVVKNIIQTKFIAPKERPYNQAGKSEPRFAGCQSQGVPWFQSRGQWGARGYENIAPGDAIFFDWDGDGSADHVGLVIGTDGERVYTVEGNSGDACKIKSYPVNYSCIKGYGLMNWN